MTHEKSPGEKIEIVDKLLSLPVMERMTRICGHGSMKPIVARYDRFLEALENGETRAHLESLNIEDRNDSCYRELKDEGHRFNRELIGLLHHTFEECHPIHQAVVF